MGKNAIVGQSGGPTSVINASLAGVFESCKSRGADIVYGMCNGVAGLLEERVVDLSTVLTDDLDIELLKKPTCPIKDKTISSRSRYDRFDTSPSIFSWKIYDLYIANRP